MVKKKFCLGCPGKLGLSKTEEDFKEFKDKYFCDECIKRDTKMAFDFAEQFTGKRQLIIGGRE